MKLKFWFLERKKSGDFITDKDFEVIKYLISKGKAKVHFTEDDIPNQSAIQQQYQNFSSGGTFSRQFLYRENNSLYFYTIPNWFPIGSKREQLRTNITQPIISAAQTGSVRLLDLLIEEGADVNWFDNNLNTAMDMVYISKKILLTIL